MRIYQNFAAFIFLAFVPIIANAQQQPINQISILTFNTKKILPADVGTWPNVSGSCILVAQKMPQSNVNGIKLVVQIKRAGALVCGKPSQQSAQIDSFTVRNFSSSELTANLTQCPILKAGSYTLCVQFFNIDNYPISREVCKEFEVEDIIQIVQSYSPPQNISPSDKNTFTVVEAKAPINFRWTPLVPKPKETVIYRLKVWQLMQGQNGTQAMKTNSPVFEKDVQNITQAVATSLYTGPCKPPYMCNFVWAVQAMDKDEKPLGNNNGTSELSSFSIEEDKVVGKILQNISPANNQLLSLKDAANPIAFRWTPITPKLQETVTYRLKVWQLMQGQNGTQAMRTNRPIVTKDVDNVTEVVVSNIYTGPCKPPYMCDFVWAVQAMNRDGQMLAESKEWSFGATNPTVSSSLVNIYPVDKKEFAVEEAIKPLTFRWTPLVPKPQQLVTYRLKVWQLMQGQNGTQAMRSNPPIVTKDVDNVTEVVISNIYTGPCKPPYMCNFVWAVEAMDSQRNKLATSESSGFDVADKKPSGARVSGSSTLNLIDPVDNKQLSEVEVGNPILFSWTNVPLALNENYSLEILNTGPGGKKFTKVTGNTSSFLVSPADLDLIGCNAANPCNFRWNVTVVNTVTMIIVKVATAQYFSSKYPKSTVEETASTEPSTSSDCATTSIKSYAIGDKIKLSDNFEMKLTQVPTGNNDSLVGKGTVDVKWIGVLNVQFQGIRVTCDDKLDTGAVYTVNDAKQEYPTQWAINVLNNTGIPKWTVAKIKSLAAGIDSNKITKPLIEAANSVTTPASLPLNMPLGYFQQGDGAFGALGFTEMVFKKDKAEFEVIASLNTAGIFKEPSAFYGTDAIGLQGKGIQFTDKGLKKINGEIKLVSPVTFTYAAAGGGDLKMVFNTDGDGHIGNSVVFRDTSSVYWRYNLDINVDLPDTWLKPVDESKTFVDLGFQVQINKWDNFILEANIPACTIPNSNGIGFEASTIVYDHSTTDNVADMEFPENYGDQDTTEMFSGFYIKAFNMTLPDGLRSYADTTKPIKLGTENLVINKDGITGKIYAHNVLSYPIANIGNLGGSIDTVDIELFKKTLTKASMKGKITIPISNGDEENSKLNYTALFVPASAAEDTSRSISFTLEPDGDIDTKFLGKGKIQVYETSNLNLVISKRKGEQRKIILDIDVNGKLYYPGGKIANPINPSKPFELDLNCKFEHMNLKYDNLATEKLNYDPGTWSFASPQKKLAGFNFTIEDVKPVINSLSLTGQFIFRGGVQFKAKINIGSDNSKFKISGDVTLQVLAGIKSSNHTVNSSSDTSGVKKYWGYLTHLKPEFIGVRVSEINVDASLSAVDIKGKVVFFRDDILYGSGFRGDLQAKFKTLNMTISAGAIFGNTKYIPSNTAPDFKYWMVQAQVIIPPPGIVFMSGLAFRGFGVGVYSKMSMSPPATFNPSIANSTTFGGATFTPNSSILIGFKVKALIATTPKEETFNGSVALSGQFSSTAGLEFIQFDGTFACGAKIGEEPKAFASGLITVKYDFVNKIFDLKSYLNIDTRAKGIDIYTPSPIYTTLFVDSKNNKWYFKSGIPTNPMSITVYGVQTNSYLMFGNNLAPDIPNGFMQLTKDGWASAGLTPMAFVDNATAQNKYKSAKGFAFGVAVRGGSSNNSSVFDYGGTCWTTCTKKVYGINVNYPCSQSQRRYLNVSYSYIAGGEVDASLLQYNGCTGFNNGWRASVSAALYAGATVAYTANFPLSGCNNDQGGTLCSFKAGATAIAEFPNPTYFKAHIEGSWSVGGYTGSCTKDITLGTQCVGTEQTLDPSINESTIYQQQNVKDSLKKKLITKIVSPSATNDNARNVKFSALLEYQYNEAFDLQEQQADGSTKVRSFRVLYTPTLSQDSMSSLGGSGSGSVEGVTASGSTSKSVASKAVPAMSKSGVTTATSTASLVTSANPTLEDAGFDPIGAKQWRLTGSGSFTSTVGLKPNTSYKFQLHAVMQEKLPVGVWVPVKIGTTTTVIQETQSYYFKTNSEPVGPTVTSASSPALIIHSL